MTRLASVVVFLVSLALPAAAAHAQNLVPQISVSFDTEEANIVVDPDQYFAPANVVSAWVEDELGNFVGTVARTQSSYVSNLTEWIAMRPLGDVDGISGATRLNHLTPMTGSWDVTDPDGQPVPNGSYLMVIELADSNSAAGNGTNNTASFAFTIDGTEKTDNPPAAGGFSNIAITYALVEEQIDPEDDPALDPDDPDNPGPGPGGDEDSAETGVENFGYDSSIDGGCRTTGRSGSAAWFTLIALGLIRLRRRRAE